MNVFRSILEHFDVDTSDWREVGVVLVGAALLAAGAIFMLVLRYVIYRLEHPDSPFWR